MILTVTDIQPGDARHLFCTDPRLKEELARAKRCNHQPVRPAAAHRSVDLADRVPTKMPRPAA